MKQRKAKDKARLLELLGGGDEPAPSLFEARIIQEDAGMVTGKAPQRTSCGKVGYSSESACKQAGKNRLKRGANCAGFRSYRCPDCGTWHLTSDVKTKKK